MGTSDLVKIFWTGGWDSTFRVLYLALVEKRPIQPYYIQGIGRKSQREEILAIELIKKELFKKYPETEHLIKPTLFIVADDIAANQELRQSFVKVQEEFAIGNQYYFMSGFAKETGIHGIEVCMQLRDYHLPEGPLANILSEGSIYIDQKHYNTDFYKVFGFFSFPLLNISKLEMKRIATEFNFLDLLNKSWFCHHPVNGKPCGICLPCMIVMEEKMYERMPLTSKVRYYTSPKRYLKSFLRQSPKYNYKAKKLFGRVMK